MSKRNKHSSKSRYLDRLKHRDLPKYHHAPATPVQATAPSGSPAKVVTITPREQRGDNVAHESKPAPVVMIFQSELDYISRCILDCPRIETGGQLFGHWTATGIPVVEYAIGPGPRANHQTTFFNQDVDYLVRVGQTIVDRYGLQHIGEWHSHHQLGLAHPSGHDAATMVNNIARQHLRRFLLCIGNCDSLGRSTLNAFTFHEDHQYAYVHAPWHVMPEPLSPYRQRIDIDLAAVLRHPRTAQPSHKAMLLAQPATTRPDYDVAYWLNDKSNNIVLKRIIDQLPMLDPSTPCTVQPKLDERQHLHLLVQRGQQHEHIYFPAAFPHVPPEVSFQTAAAEHYPGANAPEATQPSSTAGILWNYDGHDIYRAFIDYYKQLF
ncbi:MAG: Mov34/MPN/PAD-1 family protein [Muribaculaceae bacterium]|nr:Mov34/MPN/PAD-1 family protein [Muribaculaceae bacterium]